MPGPIAITFAHSIQASKAFLSKSSVSYTFTIASGNSFCITSRFSFAVNILTSPAPVLNAAFAHKNAAPVISLLPAITRSFPYVPLLE